MSLQAISAAYDTTASASAAKWKQEIADINFATLLNSDGKTATGTPLTPAAEQPDPNTKPKATTEPAKEKEKTPAEQFLEYMKKSPAQRWHESWLKAHHLTEEEFAALPAEKKQALEDQMAKDLKEQAQQTAEKKTEDASVI